MTSLYDSVSSMQEISNQMVNKEQVNHMNIKIYQNTIVVGRPGSGKTSLVKEIIKEKIIDTEIKVIWISGSPQSEGTFRDLVFLFKRVSTVKELDSLLSNIEMNVTGDNNKFCIIFDDLQMLIPYSRVYCSFLANGRHFNVFCITLLQSIEFYTKNWRTIIDNTFNYIMFNLGSVNKNVCRILCGNTTRHTNETSWKMLAYRKAIMRNYGYILYSSNEQLLTNITSTYVFVYKGWKGVSYCLRERVGIKADHTNIILLSITELSRLLTKHNATTIYDLIGVKEKIYRNETINVSEDDTLTTRLQENVE